MGKPSHSTCRLWLGCAALLFACLPVAAQGASDDAIQVNDDAINQPGQWGLDTHLNYVADGIRTPQWPGDAPAHHSFRTTLDFSYGYTSTWELGAMLPFLRTGDGRRYLEGGKVHVKYMAPNAGRAFYWGVNQEMGWVSLRSEQQHWNLEVRPILGYRTAHWNLAFNPAVEFGLSAPGGPVVEFSPSARASYALSPVHRALRRAGADLALFTFQSADGKHLCGDGCGERRAGCGCRRRPGLDGLVGPLDGERHRQRAFLTCQEETRAARSEYLVSQQKPHQRRHAQADHEGKVGDTLHGGGGDGVAAGFETHRDVGKDRAQHEQQGIHRQQLGDPVLFVRHIHHLDDADDGHAHADHHRGIGQDMFGKFSLGGPVRGCGLHGNLLMQCLGWGMCYRPD